MPKGIYPRTQKNRKYTSNPVEAAHKRAWSGNGAYKKKGLSYDDWLILAKGNCHYCGRYPTLCNPYGNEFRPHHEKNGKTFGWWIECWIYLNGIDKIVPTPDYRDLSNLVSCCRTCNFMKGVLSYELFMEHCLQISLHHLTLSSCC